MKKSTSLYPAILFTLMLMFCSSILLAQGNLTLPRVSPYAEVTQRIGITDISVTYHRPAVNEREVWGKLVPYNEGNPMPWRAGANENTTFSTTHEISVEGKTLATGTYGLHMIPGQDKWTVIFSSNSTSWGSFSYDPEEDVLRVDVTPAEAPHTEWLEYGFKDIKADGVTLTLNWEKMEVPIHIGVDANTITFNNIKNELRSTAGFTWQGFQQAANFCLQNDTELEQGLKWIDQALTGFGQAPNFTMLSTQSKLLGKLDRQSESEQVMDQALDAATNMELYQYAAGFVAADPEKSFNLFKLCAEKYPDTWLSYAGLAAGNRVTGNAKEAIKYYKKSLEGAPDQWKPSIEARIQSLEK